MNREQRLIQETAVVSLVTAILTGGRIMPDAKFSEIHHQILWPHLIDYLSGCGYARLLSSGPVKNSLQTLVPHEFFQAMKSRARADALRELSHRETLLRIHALLEENGKHAILLKGAALYLMEESAGHAPSRVPGDIDIWLESPDDARWLRSRLLDHDFAGDPSAPQTAPHHLAPVSFRHSAVEIHLSPMPAFWGLPSSALLRDAVVIPGWPAFSVFSPVGMVLHEAVHCTSHLWSFGMKLPLDLHRIVRLSGSIDWTALHTLVRATYFPAAFWSSMSAILDALPQDALPTPPDYGQHIPADARTAAGRRLASARLLTACDNADALNPVVRNLAYLKMMGWSERLDYIRYLRSPEATVPRRTALGAGGGQSWKKLPAHLLDAWRQWGNLK